MATPATIPDPWGGAIPVGGGPAIAAEPAPTAAPAPAADPWGGAIPVGGTSAAAAPAPAAAPPRDPWGGAIPVGQSASIFQTTPQEPARHPSEGTNAGDPWYKRATDWVQAPLIDDDVIQKYTGWDPRGSNGWIRGAAHLAEGMTSPLNLGLLAATLGGSTLLESGGSAALKAAGMGAEEIAQVTRGAEILGNAQKVGKGYAEGLQAVSDAGLSPKIVTDGLQTLAKSGMDKATLLSNGIVRRIASSGLRSVMQATPENIAVAENIGKWGQVALDAGFSAQLAYGGAQYSSALFDAIKDKEWDRAKELAVELAGTGYFAVATGRGALHEAGYQSTPGTKFGVGDLLSDAFRKVKDEFDSNEANKIEAGVRAANFLEEYRKKFPDRQDEANQMQVRAKMIVGMDPEEAVRRHNLMAQSLGLPERQLPLPSDLTERSRPIEIPRTPDAVVDYVRDSKEHFALISAEKSGRTAAENATQTAALLDELKSRGFSPMEAEGVYKGGAEKSFFVPGMQPEVAAELGRKYGQESVLTREGMHNFAADPKNDTVNPSSNKKLIVGDAARQLDNHTVVRAPDGTEIAFSVPTDPSESLAPGYLKWKRNVPVTFEEMHKQFGTAAKIEDTAIIDPNGKGVAWGSATRHPQIFGVPENGKADAINESGGVRLRNHGPNQGMVASLPFGGITEEQKARLLELAGKPLVRLEAFDPMHGGKSSGLLESPTADQLTAAIDKLVNTRVFTPDELMGKVPELVQTRASLRDQFRKAMPGEDPAHIEAQIAWMELHANIYNMPLRNFADLVGEWRAGGAEGAAPEGGLRKEVERAEVTPDQAPKVNAPPVGKQPLANPGQFAGSDVSRPALTYHEAAQGNTNPYVRNSANGTSQNNVPNTNRQLLMQFSSDLLSAAAGTEDMASRYYDKLYSGTRPGYARMSDFWEIPQWMGYAAHIFPDADVYVVRNPVEAVEFLNKAGYGRVAFSALDVNKEFIKDIAGKYKGRIDVGGYVDPKTFEGMENVKWHDSLKSMAEDAGVDYKEGVDYRHFAGSDTIPRLTMSTGCAHLCAFCTIEKAVKMPPKEVIEQATDAIAGMGSKLVYINDKTFGQAKNYEMLSELNDRVRAKNPDFQGFIVQTTAAQMGKLPEEWLAKSGIKFVELGIETYNDPILKAMHKPATEKIIDKSVDKLRKNNIALIPNIIIGLPGETAETYAKTLNFLHTNRDIISHANIYNLAVYENTELGKSLTTASPADFNENVLEKSFHANPEVHRQFAGDVYGLAGRLLDQSPQALHEAHPLREAQVMMEDALEQRRAGAPSGSIVDLRKKLAEFQLTGEPRRNVTKESVGDILNRGTLRDLDPLTLGSSDRETMTGRAARIGEHELQYHMAEGSAGRKWYTEEMRAAQKNLTEIHPEFERPKTWGFFTTLSSALSGGKNPEMELRAAERIYATWKDTGELPTLQPNGKPWGTTGEGRHIDKIQRLLNENGGDPEKLFDWLTTKHPVEEVKAASGAKAPEHIPPEGEAYGMYALGPKMGPYALNKTGILSELTMDRWAARTWNRWMGTLINPENGKLNDAPTQAQREMMKAGLERIGEQHNISVAEAQAMLWYAEQDVYSRLGYDNKARSYAESARTIADEVRSGKDVPIDPENETGGPAPQDVGLPPHGGRGEAARPTSFEFGENAPLEQANDVRRLSQIAAKKFNVKDASEVGGDRNARFVLADGSVLLSTDYHTGISDIILGGKDNYRGDAVTRAVDAGLVRIAWNSKNGIAFEVGQRPTPAQMRAIAALSKEKGGNVLADITDASGLSSKHVASVTGIGNVMRAIDERFAFGQQPKNGELLGTTKFLNDGRAIVTAFKGANFSTFIHEMGHVIFENLHDLNPRLAKMAEDVYGKPGESTSMSPRGWTRDQHEAFAKDVETFHLKGTPPPGAEAALPLLQQVKGYMQAIYQRLRNSPVRQNVFTPEKQRFFDEMYGQVDPRQYAKNHWTEKPAVQELAQKQLMKQHYSKEEGEKLLQAYNPANWRPETDEMAQHLKGQLDKNLETAMVNGVLKQGTADYLPRIYKEFGDNPLSNRLKTEVQSGNFATNSPMARHRMFQSETEAMLHGYKLTDHNPGQLTAWNMVSMERAKANRDLIQGLLDKGYRGSDGRPWVALDGKAQVVHDENGENPAILASPKATRDIRISDTQIKTMQESGDLARHLTNGDIVKYGKGADGTPHYAWGTDGFKTIPHGSFTEWEWKTQSPDGTPVLMKSDIKVHPEVYDYIMRRMGLEKAPESPIKKGVLALGREAKGILLFGSPFHLFQESLRAVMTGISPFGIERFDLNNPLHRLAAEKGVWEGRDIKGADAFSEGLVGHSKVIGAIPGLKNLQSWLQSFLFDKYIPGLKLRAFERLNDAYKRSYPEWTDSKVAEVAAMDTNERFGGLPYKRMGRSAATQDWFRTVALAPDWLESETRFMARMFGSEGKVARRDVALTAVGLWAAARVLNYLSSGQLHNEAPFGVAVKDKDGKSVIYSMRSIPSDMMHAVSDPGGFLKGRVSPLVRTGYEAYSGRDEYGRKLPEHALMYDVLRNVAPIWAQTASKVASGELNVSPGEQATRALGMMTRTYKTQAQSKAAELASNRSESGPVDKDALRHHQMTLELTDRVRSNQVSPADLNQMVAAGTIMPKELKQIWKTAKETEGLDPESARLYTRASRLPMPDFKVVWDLATNKEKVALTPLLQKKRKAYIKHVFTDLPPSARMTDHTYKWLQSLYPNEPAI